MTIFHGISHGRAEDETIIAIVSCLFMLLKQEVGITGAAAEMHGF
jgi:hypothetical protein